MQHHLRAAFAEMREYLLGAGLVRREVLARNARGDLTRAFDAEAEARCIDYFRREVAAPVRIMTEERGEVRTGPGPAAWTLVVDPVDGSENFARGNEFTAVALALLPGDEAEARLDAVTHSLVGSVFTGTLWEAALGEGAWRGEEPLQPSTVTALASALVGTDSFKDKAALARVQGLLHTVRDVRRFGSAATELALVASGGLDAYVDVRGTLSPENYMASYLLLREAGAVVSDPAGGPLAPVRSMTQGQGIVAACTPQLHAQILAALGG
jgi:myo-inositol-1(or 4)-monophosphatase